MFLGLFCLWFLAGESPIAAGEPLAAELCSLLSNTVPGSSADEDDLEVRVIYRLGEGDIFLDISEIYYAADTKLVHMIERKTVPVSRISKVVRRAAPDPRSDERFYVLISFEDTGGAYKYSSDKSDRFARLRSFQLGLFSGEQSGEIVQLLARITALLRERQP